MSVKFQGEGILKVKKALHVPILHFPGRGWGFKGWERGFEPNYPPQEVYVIFLEQHILKSIFFYFYFFYCLNRAKCNIKIYATNFV